MTDPKREKLHRDLDEYLDFLAGRKASGDLVVHVVSGDLRTWEFETSEKVAPWRKE